MKKNGKFLLLTLVSASSSVFASGLGIPMFEVDNCQTGGSVSLCTMKQVGSVNSGNSGSSQSNIAASSAAIAAGGTGVAALLAEDKTTSLLQPANVKGSHNSSVNPFIFCSGGRPSRGNPLRKVYDQICPDGKVTPEQAAQKNGLTNHVNDAKSLGNELKNMGTAGMIGIGLSEAAKKTLGASTDNQGNSLNVNNNMSFNDYNRQVYNEIRQEDYLRQQENWKAAQDPEYVKKIIPDSNSFQTNQNVIAGQQSMIDNLNNEALSGANKLSSSNQQVIGSSEYAANAVTNNVHQSGQNQSTQQTPISTFNSHFR